MRLFLLAFLILGPASGWARESFPTPGAAAQEMMKAIQSGDEERLVAIFGPEGRQLVDTGDPVRNQRERQRVAAAAREHWVLRPVDKSRTRMTLIVGHSQWPFPVPLVKSGGGWQFDTETGKREVLARRIGRNELDTIKTLHDIVEAQHEYAAEDRDGDGLLEYASRLFSSPGHRDGLYWEASTGERSPIAEAVAQASAEGYRRGSGQYHGYRYKLLRAQGPQAPAGTMNYMAGDSMIGGFGLVAWPATYGSSGVKSFVVSHAGTIYEKDLGPGTDRAASSMTAFNPDRSWRPVQ